MANLFLILIDFFYAQQMHELYKKKCSTDKSPKDFKKSATKNSR